MRPEYEDFGSRRVDVLWEGAKGPTVERSQGRLHRGQHWWPHQGSEDRNQPVGNELRKCWSTFPSTVTGFSFITVQESRHKTFVTCSLHTVLVLPLFDCFCTYSGIWAFLLLNSLSGENTNKCPWLFFFFSFSFRLYKELALEMGFEEFHLYLRPVHFEFATHKDKVDQSPPVFITSLLEDNGRVDRWVLRGPSENTVTLE